MIRFTPLRPELMLSIASKPPWVDPTPELAAALCAAAPDGGPLAVALVEDGRPMIAGGLVSCGWPGRWYAWLHPDKDVARRHWLLGYRFLRRRLDRLARDPAYARIEAYTDARTPFACAFIERLGFAKEGVLRQFREGTDYSLYARVIAP